MAFDITEINTVKQSLDTDVLNERCPACFSNHTGEHHFKLQNIFQAHTLQSGHKNSLTQSTYSGIKAQMVQPILELCAF